jgi:hypothetical protein
MNDLDLDQHLATRLSAIEARAPGSSTPPELERGRRRGRAASG